MPPRHTYWTIISRRKADRVPRAHRRGAAADAEAAAGASSRRGHALVRPRQAVALAGGRAAARAGAATRARKARPRLAARRRARDPRERFEIPRDERAPALSANAVPRSTGEVATANRRGNRREASGRAAETAVRSRRGRRLVRTAGRGVRRAIAAAQRRADVRPATGVTRPRDSAGDRPPRSRRATVRRAVRGDRPLDAATATVRRDSGGDRPPRGASDRGWKPNGPRGRQRGWVETEGTPREGSGWRPKGPKGPQRDRGQLEIGAATESWRSGGGGGGAAAADAAVGIAAAAAEVRGDRPRHLYQPQPGPH